MTVTGWIHVNFAISGQFTFLVGSEKFLETLSLISSDRSSYSDSVPLEIQLLCEISNISANILNISFEN